MTRGARMLAGLLLCGVLAAAPAQAAETEVDSVAVKGSAESTATSQVRLKPGVKYRLVVTGTSTQSVSDGNSTLDALYCFQATGGDQCNPPAPTAAALGLAYYVSGRKPTSTESITDFTNSNRPAYNGGHSYSFSYTPSVAGYLFLQAWPGFYADDTVTRTGSFTVTIYGPDSDSGCIEYGEGPADDNTPCEWQADWNARGTGPTDGDSSTKRVEVRAKGHLDFAHRPRNAKWLHPDPKGAFAFIRRFKADPYYNNGNPFSNVLHFRLINARVRYSKQARILDLDARVSDVTGLGNTACAEGGAARITLTQRGGSGRDELRLVVHNGELKCLDYEFAGDKLTVKIELPVRMQ